MKNIITQFSRLFVGVLFIISGLIKLNDPVGFSYKLAEYFSEPVFNMPFLEPLSLGLAIFLVIFLAPVPAGTAAPAAAFAARIWNIRWSFLWMRWPAERK